MKIQEMFYLLITRAITELRLTAIIFSDGKCVTNLNSQNEVTQVHIIMTRDVSLREAIEHKAQSYFGAAGWHRSI